MHTGRQKFGVACAAAAFLMPLAFGQSAAAIPIAVAPVVVQMDTVTEFSAVQVSNRGDRPTSVETAMVKVKWVDGREVYEPTSDFTVSPPVFRLQGGKSRMIRFKYAGQRQDSEGFYRLFIHQLPEKTEGSQVSIIFNLGVPIFIAPLSSRPALMLDASGGQDKPAELHNTGNVTLTVIALEGQDCPSSPHKVMLRLSPAQTLVLKDAVPSCVTRARTDQGVIRLAARPTNSN
jgi:P pilus assembly chaperone PapD